MQLAKKNKNPEIGELVKVLKRSYYKAEMAFTTGWMT